MTALLLVLALAAQSADAALACRNLQRGAVELNPLHGQSCRRVVLVKSAFLAATPLFPAKHRRLYLGAMAGTGMVGVALSVTLTHRRE